jgi:multiple sugar transport system permease protein
MSVAAGTRVRATSRTRRRRGRTVEGQARRADVWTYFGLLVVLIFFGAPLLWILSLSLRDQAEVLAATLNPIPSAPTLDNYTTILQSAQFPHFLLNSLLLSLGGAIGAMLVTVPAAYAFSRLDFRGRKGLLLGVLALQMISPLVVAFPLYRYFASLGLLDSMVAVGAVYVAILMPLATWMLKGFFDGIPKDLDDAALLDGASRPVVLWRVVLPIARPGLTAVFVLMAILAWGEFVIPYILLTSPSRLPISVGILNFQGTYATNATGILAAGGVLAILPAVLVFVVLQRFIVGAFLAGALKG